MCPNEGEPLLPRRWDSLYDSEAGSDVIFLVGPEQLRLPGHRSILANENPVFRAMLQGPLARPPSEAIPVEDVDGRAFDHLLRFLYGGEVVIQSVPTALSTLYAAYKYLCPDLVHLCIAYLDAHLDPTTVLEVFSHISLYTRQACAPSAPPLDDTLAPSPSMPSCDKLLHNCMRFIDHHADEVLAQEDLEDLSLEALSSILGRDSLGVSSESVVFASLNRWCNRECKRRQLELTEDNRRRVLGDDALFLVRYLLLGPEHFLAGPMQSGWLDQRDSAAILSHMLHHKTESVSKRLEDRWPLLERPRAPSDVGVFPLSARSGVGAPRAEACKEKDRKGKKKKKDKKKGKNRSSPEREKRGSGSKFAECLCGVIACILD